MFTCNTYRAADGIDSVLMFVHRVVYALIIINKAGGLIFQRDFAEGLNKLNINDYLVLAGTFHGYTTPPLPSLILSLPN